MAQNVRRFVDGCVIGWIGAVFILAIVQSYLNIQIRYLDSAWVEPPMEETQKLHPRVYQTLTFGHLPLAVDWLWMRVLQDPAIAHVEAGRHPHAFYDLDLATDLDPGFYELYTSGANLLTVIRDDAPGGRDLLLKGNFFRKRVLSTYPEEFRHKYWENSWGISTLLAYIYIFEMNDMALGAAAFKEAADIPGSPPYLQNLKHRLEKPDGQYEVSLKLINFLIGASTDDRARQNLERKREALFISQYLFNLNDQFGNFLKADPKYQLRTEVSHEQLKNYWKRFREINHLSSQDPWGGELKVEPTGKISSTTPHQKVFGLE